ncbi:MAG TPA: DUF721 domain-containing protein [Micropepsaceae bacterium]|nr:DUF721 domain-containing protein [Micropepsaceae bacterium]
MSRTVKSAQSQGGAPSAPRHGWAKPAGETALGEASGAFARAGFTDATLLLRWADIVGSQVARIARPAKWQDGPEGATLTLKCEAGAVVFLQHQTRELTDRLNAYLGRGRIVRLKLVAGRLASAPEPPAHPAPKSDISTETLALSDAISRLAKVRAALKPARPKSRG